MTLAIRDRTAITGIGWTSFTKGSDRTEIDLATDAALMAIDDAGLEVGDIDGLVSLVVVKNGMVPDSPDPGELVSALGLTACNYQAWDGLGGAWVGAAFMTAAMAIHAGVCRHVLVYRANNGRSGTFPITTEAAKTDGPDQWRSPFGVEQHAAANFGPAVTAHMARYGTTTEDFGHLAVVQREHARLNRKALMREPLTLEQHAASPWIAYPFRLLDCCQMTDGGVAAIVSAADCARGLRRSPVLITGMQGGSLWTGTKTVGLVGAWETNARVAAQRLYAGAGITAANVDFAELYDPFTGVLLLQLEGFGLVPEGESGAAVRARETALDGRIPTNTHGGLLSEAHTGGLGHVVEAVQQLRDGGVVDDECEGAHDYDRAHCRQLRQPEVGLVCGVFGDSALLLRRDT